MEIREPNTETDWQQYFRLRTDVLGPLHADAASLQDGLEDDSYHVMAVEADRCIGVGRVHFNHSSEGQIRFMAVAADSRRRGVGLAILETLEIYLLRNAVAAAVLNVRPDAIGFYEKHGYQMVENGSSDTSVKMRKPLMR